MAHPRSFLDAARRDPIADPYPEDRMLAWVNEDPQNERIFWSQIYPKLLSVQLQVTGQNDGPIVLRWKEPGTAVSKKTGAQAQARGPVLVESLASLPQFCAPLVKEGEPGLAYGIDFWAVAPSGNAVADYERGSAYADDLPCGCGLGMSDGQFRARRNRSVSSPFCATTLDMTAVRILAAALFFAMMFVWWKIAHFVTSLGLIPWLLMMVGIFWVTLKIENHGRALEGRPPYSWYDAGHDAREVLPVVKFWIVAVAIGFVLTRFI